MKSGMIFLGIFFFLTSNLFANTGTLSGKVIDKNTLKGLSGVNIYLEGTHWGNFTDNDGGFSIQNISPGDYYLKASTVGYGIHTIPVTIDEGQNKYVELFLVESIEVLEGIIIGRVSLTGGSSMINKIPGSSHFLSPAELDKFSYQDINRMLYTIPGLTIQEEDGFGQRPNIGMRGTGAERSSKITLMEDGILMAPAPYSAPAAYYFPTAARMYGIEVRKGSSQIKFGPNTTGGAINLISTPVPDNTKADMHFISGNYGYRNLYASAGTSGENIGVLIESIVLASDGFKELDNGGNTGFTKQDYQAKVRFNTNKNAKIYQAVNIKAGNTTENSNETYLGLTDEDFDKTPNRRYAGSQKDNIVTDHFQWHLRHLIQPVKFLDITTTVYRNEFQRNWYKLDKIKLSPADKGKSISDIVSDPSLNPDYLNLVTGYLSSDTSYLQVKANNREYYSEGIESVVGLHFNSGITDHEIEIGFRYHRDQMDRFQWTDNYIMDGGIMKLEISGEPGTESNLIEQAGALAGYLQYRLSTDRLIVIPGLRYEGIEMLRLDYGKTDPGREGQNLTEINNHVGVWIPGIGIDYMISSKLTAFFGVHKGFSPPGPEEGTLPEKSINYELGARYNRNHLAFQQVLYFNHYTNLLGSDLAASGGSGSTEQFNAGESTVYGAESEFSFNMLHDRSTSFSLPLAIAYTFTQANFQNTFDSDFEPWGTVESGDEIPYIPKHQFSVTAGLGHRVFDFEVRARYSGKMRTRAGSGDFMESETVQSYFVTDMSVNYNVVRHFKIFGSVLNVFDATYAVSRHPAGLRPGLPRGFQVGIKASLE